MKTTIWLSMGCLLAAAAAPAQVSETPVTIGLADGGNPQGYLKGADGQGVRFSTSASGRGRLIPYGEIRGEGIEKLIRFDDRSEELSEARSLFAAGNYVDAAEAFGQVAAEYAIITGAPRNFASEALFYQLESLRRAGRYERLASVVDSAPVETIENNLGERYQRMYQFQRLWALYGAERMGELRIALETYEQPVTGDAELLGVPRFEKMPGSQLAQLAFLRGKAYAAEGETLQALDDYHRAMSFGNGNDPLLAKLAMGAAMVLQEKATDLEDERARAQMQSVAYLYGERFGKDSMPSEFREYATRPAMEAPPQAEKKTEGEAEGSEGEGKEGKKGSGDEEGGKDEKKGKKNGGGDGENGGGKDGEGGGEE